MIFGINTTSDISKLLYVISRAVRRVKFETILCQISLTNHAIICLYYYPQTFCRYYKLSWNTTSLSQSNCRNFSCSSISKFIPYIHTGYARSAIFKFKGSFPRVSFRKWWLEIVNDGRRIISKGSVTIAKHGRQYVKREWQWCTLGYSQCQDLFSPTKKTQQEWNTNRLN